MKRWFYLFSIIFMVFAVPLAHASYSNDAQHWGFNRSKNHKPADAGPKYEKLLEKHNAFYLGDTSKKEIYLTFDNGYEEGYTGKFLDVLKKKTVPAAFFVTGDYLNDKPDLVKRMVKEGHIVGNHSWNHPDLTEVSDEQLKQELTKVEEKFEEITGVEGMSYLRPPRGIFSDRTLALSKELGYTNVFWSLAFVDWKTDDQKGWEYAYDNIMEQIHPGAIILLHTVSKDNADALEKVIDDLRKKGYVFKSIESLLIEKTIPEPMLYH